MTITYFISPADVKGYTPANSNIDDKRLVMSIRDAQEINIQQILGGNLYSKLKTLIQTQDILLTPNAHYKTLLDEYIIPALIRFTLTEAVPFLVFKMENKSTSLQNSDNSNPVDLESLKYFIELNKNRSEYYGKRLTDYLIANFNLFPEYTTVTSIDQILPSSSPYFSGMQLDRGYDCDRFLGLNSHTIDLN